MTGGQLPVLRPREVARALERMGFILARTTKGSHSRYVHSDGRRTTLPMHEGKTIGRGLLRKILRDVGITAEELHGYL